MLKELKNIGLDIEFLLPENAMSLKTWNTACIWQATFEDVEELIFNE